jgi:hypothetical protein
MTITYKYVGKLLKQSVNKIVINLVRQVPAITNVKDDLEDDL